MAKREFIGTGSVIKVGEKYAARRLVAFADDRAIHEHLGWYETREEATKAILNPEKAYAEGKAIPHPKWKEGEKTYELAKCADGGYAVVKYKNVDGWKVDCFLCAYEDRADAEEHLRKLESGELSE
ncbi:hypothetical protein FACS1894120_5170 [Clostridia bacterium]|nr:hypothetical protein FACS1894120_5170 [Clostridia bacterium]